jgi:Beta-ketoacyl synthase, N-terminal domain
MSAPLTVWVDGMGLWTTGIADWPAFGQWLRGDEFAPAPARPLARVLPANERRRAPESVLLALDAAGQAVAMSGHDAADLPCIFASVHGDQSITDYMCATLAATPAELSPIRFHNSVHNAPAGYWTIATGCRAGSSAVAAGAATFGAGLLEAASQALADARPILLVVFDTAGSGPLLEITGARRAFATAMVLSPTRGEHSVARLEISLHSGSMAMSQPRDARLQQWMAESPSAAGLPMLEALAGGITFDGAISAATGLHIAIHGESVA